MFLYPLHTTHLSSFSIFVTFKVCVSNQSDFYFVLIPHWLKSDKQLENLQVVIIDEFSFIKADMLYLLDLRLREIKQVNDVPFGGVSIFYFGDISQLLVQPLM